MVRFIRLLLNEKGRFLWSAHRITERQKAGKARSIKGKQLKNSRSTVSKQLVALRSSASDNRLLRLYQNGSKSPENQGLTVVRNYKSCGLGRERCDRVGHAVFLRPREDSAIMGSASTGISTSSTKLKMISTFCLRLPPDLSGA